MNEKSSFSVESVFSQPLCCCHKLLRLLVQVMDYILISYNVRIALTKPGIVDRITKKLAETGMEEGVV